MESFLTEKFKEYLLSASQLLYVAEFRIMFLGTVMPSGMQYTVTSLSMS
jgi:hypothetical protein